ncbi:MAG: DUF2794 domain-containing protein [Neomegalonema sp.]|nr:DUF2794 domain-containing protein [Neomegalonema sp.]
MSTPIIPFEIGPGGRDERPRPPTTPTIVTFHRTELSPILAVYGRMVAAGEWRDYAIDHLREVALFSVFRHTAESPLYRIEKRPKLAQRQGAYAVIGHDGRVLKRGRELAVVLKFFDRKLMKLIDRD